MSAIVFNISEDPPICNCVLHYCSEMLNLIEFLLLQARAFIHEHGKAIDESRHQSSAMESAKRKAVEMEKELASAKSALAAADKLLEERGQRLLNVNLQLGKERLVLVSVLRLRKWHEMATPVERILL